MTAHIVFITHGDYSARKTVALVACCDEQVAEVVKGDILEEVARLTAIALGDEEATVEIEDVGDNFVCALRWMANGNNEDVRGYMQTKRMDGFRWYTNELPEVVIVEVPAVGVWS